MYKELKVLLKSKLSHRQVNLSRLVKDVLKNPARIKQELNNFQNHENKVRVAEIDYVPTVFGATIVDSCNLRCPIVFIY